MNKPTPRNTTARWRVGVLAGLMALTGVLAGCSQPSTGTNPSETSPVQASTTVGLTYIPNIQFAPFYLADAEKFLSDNVTVTLRHHGAGEGLFTALGAGEEQFVVAGGDEILQARSQGVDIVAVASYYGRYPARIIVPENSPINSVADLKGHSVGLPGKYGENWFALLIALKEAGLTETDVTITEIGYTQQAALSTGKVDSVIGFANSDVINFQTAGFPVKVIDPKVPLVSICLATTSSYALDNPEVVKTVIDGMKYGMQKALDDPSSALTVAANYIPSFRGDVLATAEKVLPATSALFQDASGKLSPPFDPAQWTAMAEAMGSVNLIPAGTDPAPAFTNDYS